MPSALGAYTDTSGYAWEKSIGYLTGQGILEGYADGRFRPDQKMNRAEFTKIVVAARFAPSDYQAFSEGCFADVQEKTWYTSYVCFAQNKGIVAGYPDGLFRPDAKINQAEALKVLLLTFDQKIVPATDPWYHQYLDTAERIGMLYFAGGNEAAHHTTRGEMAYFTAWLLAHEKGESVDQLMEIPSAKEPFQYSVTGTTHVVAMDAQQVTMRVLSGHDSLRAKECDYPHHCVAEAEAETFGSFVSRAGADLVVNGSYFDAYSQQLNGTNFHQISGDIVIDGVMKSMYGWDVAFGDGGMLAQLTSGVFAFYYPIRSWLGADVQQGIANYPLVLRLGAVRTQEEIGMHDANDAQFWQSLRRGGLALSEDKQTLYYVSVVGTVADLGAAMKNAGAWDGFALDAGSSNAFWLQGKTIFSPGRSLTTVVTFFD